MNKQLIAELTKHKIGFLQQISVSQLRQDEIPHILALSRDPLANVKAMALRVASECNCDVSSFFKVAVEEME